MIDDLWYKNAILYCMDVEKYVDGNGDGVGDFEGLTRKLDYLAGLGVNCLELMPVTKLPDVTIAVFADPEGHPVGLIQQPTKA